MINRVNCPVPSLRLQAVHLISIILQVTFPLGNSDRLNPAVYTVAGLADLQV